MSPPSPSLKTNANIQYIGSDIGGELTIQLSEIGLTATSIGPLVPAMKSGVPSTRGILQYSSINQLKSGPCMVTADYENGRVTMIFTMQTMVVGVLSAKAGTFTSAFVPTLTNVQFTSSQDSLNTIDVLKAVETLGGYDGYQQYLSQSQGVQTTALTKSLSTVDDSDWHRVAATLRLGSGQIPILPCYSFVVNTVENYSAIGAFWCAAIDENFPRGVELRYSSWDKLLSGRNQWTIDAGSGGIGTFAVHFTVNGEEVATLQVSGVPDEVIGRVINHSGYVDWSGPVSTSEEEKLALEDDLRSEI